MKPPEEILFDPATAARALTPAPGTGLTLYREGAKKFLGAGAAL
jgi:hypothetical protein